MRLGSQLDYVNQTINGFADTFEKHLKEIKIFSFTVDKCQFCHWKKKLNILQVRSDKMYSFWLFSDGITSPGILCVVSYAIQDAIKEKSVNLFQTVRQFHIKNPEFIASQVVYFCIDINFERKKNILLYIRNFYFIKGHTVSLSNYFLRTKVGHLNDAST